MASASAEDLREKLDAALPIGIYTTEEFLRVLSSPEELERETRPALFAEKTLQ
ncbi:hypothetical protein GGQ64_004820 [Rhizobium azooxidifex]|uniref:Uncharacterized protein n=1 Tax=Mycoplana azooxidifex TaxID=1636188 RepID=A0A7W6GKZ3_9HYPH|nr:hypothetical protein [Mycoplana azooxidifex]MBB3979576.1 hypothetical protein [Mycoplana azooxidifex]